MNSTPFKKGFLPTSTPIQPLGDSGYFGSCNRSPLAKIVHTLSPVKEISPFKKRLTDLIQTTRPHILETPFKNLASEAYESENRFSPDALVRELDFDDSSDFLIGCLNDWHTEDFHIDVSQSSQNNFPSFQLQDLIDDNIVFVKPRCAPYRSATSPSHQYYKTHLQCDSEELITNQNFDSCDKKAIDVSRNKKVDFLAELSKINCTTIVSSLLSLLSAEDLCRICCVNKNWSEIIICDVKANSRRQTFLKEKKSQKENQKHVAFLGEFPERAYRTGEYKTVLFDISNTAITAKQPLKQYNTKFDSFLQEGRNVKGEALKKCPRCHYASKNKGDKYICIECNYIFCHLCLHPFLKGHGCIKPTVSILIGSKKSKKNLKRL